MPKRSWVSIRGEAERLEVSRKPGLPLPGRNKALCESASYSDLCPQLNDVYLFGDYETTRRYINTADKHTSRSENGLYTIWLLPTNLDDVKNAIQWNFEGIA